MAQNEQTTEEHSTLEQQSPGRLDHPVYSGRGRRSFGRNLTSAELQQLSKCRDGRRHRPGENAEFTY